MIRDIPVAQVNATPRNDGHAQFGTILPSDAAMLKKWAAEITSRATSLRSTAMR